MKLLVRQLTSDSSNNTTRVCPHQQTCSSSPLPPTSFRLLMHEHFCYVSLMDSSVSRCFMIGGGRLHKYWSISAQGALSPSPSPLFFSPHLGASFYICLNSFHPPQQQTSARRRRLHTSSHIHTLLNCHDGGGGAVLRYVCRMKRQAWSQEVDNLH